VKNMMVNRHIVKEYGVDAMGENRIHVVSTIIPGVMARTGMETLEILMGVVKETKPDVVVAVDALAARSTKRLNCTIQITDTGINPGSGVLNHRNTLNEESLGVPVIAIGVPLWWMRPPLFMTPWNICWRRWKRRRWKNFWRNLLPLIFIRCL
jgi:spore protease